MDSGAYRSRNHSDDPNFPVQGEKRPSRKQKEETRWMNGG